jgi:thiamine biosynthesis lipoprotein
MRLVTHLPGRACLWIGAYALFLSACQPARPETVQEARPLMGTVVGISAYGSNAGKLRGAVDAAYAEMSRLSDMMNHYNPASVVSAINNAAGRHAVTVPPELMAVLHMARSASERSDGAFDITVGSLKGWRFDPEHPRLPAPGEIAAQLPRVNYRHLILDDAAGTAFLEKPGMRIDLGGVAKLPILHAGMRVLAKNGVHNAMIDGGGDIEVMGSVDGRPWRIGIRDARRPDRLYGVIALAQGFVVSSGDYERYFERNGKRYHHILDPRTGYPAQGVRGVTLVGDKLEDINGLSAAVMVLGPDKGRALIEGRPGLNGMLFRADGSVWISPALAGRIERIADE